MNKNKLKSYAPQARKDFVAAVKARAALLGISEEGVSLATKSGDVVIIDGREWSAKLGAQRERLAAKVAKEGFEAVMDRVAYTWFNRFAALRYLELHDYLGHGLRVLSNRDGGVPEVLAAAGEIDLPGLDKEHVVELRLAGDRDGDLYRLLLVAQCNALSAAIPFLFERIDDESELLLPDNLLRTDSLVAKMVSSIDEEDWRDVEIIGWLYQFYISEKKDAVMGKTVKSEDIPAATQLFTPEWIVKYLVQNSLGRLWLTANPSSALREKWKYYIEPAEQSGEALAGLKALVARRAGENGGRLDPETLLVLDPACGSGHILVEAYEVLKDIYLERGYQPRRIPHLILERNLFGLDIDDRAAQLAGFALLMKARADDRRILQDAPEINVLSLQESGGISAAEAARHLAPFGISRNQVEGLLEGFLEAKTFGSLARGSGLTSAALNSMEKGLNEAAASGDVFSKAAAEDLIPLLRQARALCLKYDAVIANPPYMGTKGMNETLKAFAKENFPDSKTDLFAMFIERAFDWTRESGFVGMVTMQSWMFLSSFEAIRKRLLTDHTVMTMAHLGPRAFGEISGEVVQTTAFVMQASHHNGFRPVFFRLVDGSEPQKKEALLAGENRFDAAAQDEFSKISGMPVAYWTSERLRDIFAGTPNLGAVAETKQGLATTNNALFLRQWHEVDISKAGFGLASNEEALKSMKKWFPLNKGGSLRRWYGNNEYLINFENGGKTICDYIDNTPGVKVKSNGRVINRDKYFKEGMTWSSLASGGFSMRWCSKGFIFETKGAMCFPKHEQDAFEILALFNSRLVDHFLLCISPTLDYHEGPLKLVPTKISGNAEIKRNAREAIEIARADWDAHETSWDFVSLPFVSSSEAGSLSESWKKWQEAQCAKVQRLKEIEEQNNRLFIEAYGLGDELEAEVPEAQITLARADREIDAKRLLSYAIGCMMGRYSLDKPGLVFANAAGRGFHPDNYKTFPADADGILPLTDELWFEDDSTLRVVEFLRAVWGLETSDENVAWLAESLGQKSGETPEEAVRRYLSSSFYKDHLQTYKKRPIYWLFSSGKQKAFEALVYLHRYQEGTLARMRSEYVVPLLSKYLDRIELLGRDAEAASSAAARTKIQKRIDTLRKKHHELVVFEEKLRHMADSRISVNLDEGVKANYSKFGDLLAETKAVTGGSED